LDKAFEDENKSKYIVWDKVNEFRGIGGVIYIKFK
jgi:hypothetical protein